jgi:integrase
MASIGPYRGGYRAHVCVDGERDSKSGFRTRREAKAWADRREAELEGGGAAVTFAQAAENWLALKLPTLDSVANQRTVESSINTHVLPLIGHRKLSEITRPELVGLVTALAKTGKVETAHRVGQRIRQIFDHAMDRGDITIHPAADLSRVLPAAVKKPMGAIKPGELPALMVAIDGYREPITRAGLLLLAHTFTRTSELIGATWDEIRDEETWVIPAERMKVRRAHVVPLSTQVRAILGDLKTVSDGNRHILPSQINPMLGLSNNTLLFAIYRLGYKGKMTGHGFRSVASTILNESGNWSRDAIERQLAHRETDKVREAYMRAEFLEERRRLMQWWSDHLEASLAASTAS